MKRFLKQEINYYGFNIFKAKYEKKEQLDRPSSYTVKIQDKIIQINQILNMEKVLEERDVYYKK